MRVALFSRNARPADAIGRQVVAKANAFRRLGAEVGIFLSEDTPRHPSLNDIVVLPARAVWGTHRDYLLSCDLILAEFGAAYDLMELLPALADRGPRIIIDYHGLTPMEWADPALAADLDAAQRQRGLLWCADAILVHSRFAADELRAATGIPDDRLHLLACHVPKPAAADDHSALQLRQRHGLADETLLLFVGRLAGNKRPEVLVEALRHLPPSVHAIFVGSQDDIYAARQAACADLACRLGVMDQVHFLGVTDEPTLDAWYRAADVLVVPSAHECFGLPVLEALARGTPVLSADQAALPETLGHAGLTYDGTSPEDLARHINRYFAPSTVPHTQRVALVAHRFGTHFAGGAEASLRRMGMALQAAGLTVEVFTTCNDHESRWANTLPPGTQTEDGFTVHRFPLDAYDADALGRAYASILAGQADAGMQQQFLNNALSSEALLAALQKRRHEFAAILTGPYLFKLPLEVARRFGEQVLLMPCFHDEPLAYLPAFREAYRGVGGLLFHSAAEARLTAERLAVNHPRHDIVGTVLPEAAFQGDPARGRRRCGNRYVVYCGRYCPEKGLDRLVQFMDEIAPTLPGELKLVCLGQGPLALPRRPWLLDLGFVDETTKRDVLAGALALVNLSPNESLSIVALEAWAVGTPVIVSRGCPVLVDQVQRAEGGACVASADELREVLQTWTREPEVAQQLGQAGQRFVQREYASADGYRNKLVQAVTALRRSLRDVARERGLERARRFSEAAWLQRFTDLIEQVRSSSPALRQAKIELDPVQQELQVLAGEPTGQVTLWIRCNGDTALAARGPGRARLVARVEQGRRVVTSLSSPLLPGQETLILARFVAPAEAGRYRLRLSLVRGRQRLASRTLPLTVANHLQASPPHALAPLVQLARQALAEAGGWQALPNDYVDVTEGKLAGLKRHIKHKLLNNFRRAYVDVAFRQQSALNRKLIAVMSLLLDTVAVADSGEAALRRRVERLERQLRRERRRQR